MILATSASGLLDSAKRLSGLIFYTGMLLGTGWYLAFASRRPARTERYEAFRKPARMLVLGFFLFAALALVMLTVIPPGSTPPSWASALVLILFAGAIAFIWRGTRRYFKAADAFPGKHGRPGKGATSAPDVGDDREHAERGQQQNSESARPGGHEHEHRRAD